MEGCSKEILFNHASGKVFLAMKLPLHNKRADANRIGLLCYASVTEAYRRQLAPRQSHFLFNFFM